MVEIRTLKPTVKLAMPRRPTRADPRRQQYKIVLRRNVDHPPPTPQPTPCRLWQGVEGTDGYGRRKVREADGKIRSTSMHRWVMEELHGRRLKSSEVILHACDNRLCYRVDHLSIGTVQDNNADMRAKGRGTKPPIHHFQGECHPMAKLSEHQVRAIRGHHISGLRVKTIAEMYEVAPSTIRRIVKGVTWNHAAPRPPTRDLLEEARQRIAAAEEAAKPPASTADGGSLRPSKRIRPVKKMSIRKEP